MALSPLLTRGATTFALDATQGVVISGLEEEESWDVETGGRLNRPGGVIERNLFGSIDINLRGLIRATTAAVLRTRLGALMNVLGDGGEDIFFRVNDDREIRCRPVARGRDWFPGGQYQVAEFDVTLRSVDPFWRALTATTFSAAVVGNAETTVVVPNSGDAPAPFILDITPTSGSILATTFVVQRDAPTPLEKLRIGKVIVTTGLILRIDTETGSVTDGTGSLGVADALTEFVDGVAWTFQPGANTLRLKQNGSPAPNVSYSGSFRARFRVL